MTGRIHSIQSFGAADGPGIRFLVFLQGCPLRCGCCHNPDTWDMAGGRETTPEAVFADILKYRPYFGKEGGVTISGGEPLLQPAFCRELFALCREAGIHTCLDTSGCVLNDKVRNLLPLCDLILLDMKYTEEDLYRRYVGCSMAQALAFLQELEARKIPVWLRQVFLPGLNDSAEALFRLRAIKARHKTVERLELLPFKKLCTVKYDQLGIPFPFAHLPEPTAAQMEAARKLVQE